MPGTVTLHPLDIAIVIAYMAILVLVGIYHSTKQDSLLEYFMAKKSMSWVPIGLSLMAALNSGIDYLNTPSLVVRTGWLSILMNLSWLVIYPYMFYIVIPMFRRLNVISAYEYLGRRFGEHTRTFASCLFFAWRLAWMAGALFVPCLALTTALGHPEWMVPMIVITGAVVTFYTMMGGIKAVIWNDVAQFVFMMGGLALTLIIVVSHVKGGAATVFADFFQPGMGNLPDPTIDTSSWYGRIASYFSIDLVIPGIICTWFVRLGGFTSDQTMIQRFSTAKTMWHARRSFLITAITDVAWMVALFIVGLAMVAYLKVAGELPVWVRGDYDRIFPYVMASIFPVGATGLVLAGILAASLSSVDSAINALTTIGMVDFYQRLHLKRTAADIQESPEEQRRNVRLSRILTVVIGATGIVLACFVGNLGSLFDFLSKVLGTFTGVMLAIFWLGMFTRRATGASAIAGAVAGVVIASAMSFHLWLPVGAIWIGPVSVAVTMIVGVLLGSSQPSEAALQWNWFAIVGRDWVDEAADSQATWQSPQLS